MTAVAAPAKLAPPTELPATAAGYRHAEVERHGMEWYRRQYAAGWAAAARGTDSRKYDSGNYSWAWEDGYLDRAAGRTRWHLAYCPDHDTCGEN